MNRFPPSDHENGKTESIRKLDAFRLRENGIFRRNFI